MPFCTNCGSQVGTLDKFCAICGAPQATSSGPAATPAADFLSNISPRTASVLCYVPMLGWIGSIVVLASPRFQRDRTVRFHAFQGLYLFVAWLIVQMISGPMREFGAAPGPFRAIVGIMHLVIFGAWIFMLIKTSQEEFFALPIIGEIAERSVAEQRQP